MSASPAQHPTVRRAARPTGPVASLARVVLGAGIADAVVDEAGELGAHVRRLVPTRRRAAIIGLALLAVAALGGVAGAAEPPQPHRSALQAFGGAASGGAASAAPVATAAPAAASTAPAAGVELPVASAAPVATPAAAALASQPAPAPSSAMDLPAGALGSTAMFTGPDPLDLILKGGLVIAALFITLRILRRVQGGGSGKATGMLDVVESRNLGPKTQLHLVAVGDRRFMVGQTPAGLVALGELDANELPIGDMTPLLEATTLAEITEPAAAPPARGRTPVGAERGSGALSITSLYATAAIAESQAAASRAAEPVPAERSSRFSRAARTSAPAAAPAAAPAPEPVRPPRVPAAIDPRLSDAERLGGETRQERIARLARQEAQDRAERQARIARAERAASVEQAMAAADRAARVAATAAAAAERAAMAERTVQAVERTGLSPVTMGNGLVPREPAALRPAGRRPDPSARLAPARTPSRPAHRRGEDLSDVETRLIERLAAMNLEDRSADRAYAPAPTARPEPAPAAPVRAPRPSSGISDRLAQGIASRLAASAASAAARQAPVTASPAEDDALDDPRRAATADDFADEPVVRPPRRREFSA